MCAICLPARRSFNWKVFGFGLALLFVATAVAIPFLLETDPLAEVEPWSALVLTFVEPFGVGALSLGIGLYLASRIGLGFPFIEGWLRREPIRHRLRGVLGRSIIAGIAACLAAFLFGWVLVVWIMVLGLDVSTDTEALIVLEPYPAVWKWLLISIHAGIAEEIMFRLGLMTLLAWLGGLVSQDDDGRPSPSVLWSANLLAALAFGVGHLFGGLPYPQDPAVMTRIVLQNTAAGMVFGWLYWKWGLESAMLAHFFLDVTLYVVALPVVRTGSPMLMVVALIGLALVLRWAWRAVGQERERQGRPVVGAQSQANRRPFWLVAIGVVAVLGLVIGVGVLVQEGLQGHSLLARDLKPTQTPHPALGVGSTRVSEVDGMTVVYVPAGDFEMGSPVPGQRSERPVHTVYLDAYWIDQTEVTNGMYARCVAEGTCTPPSRSISRTRPEYYGNPDYDDYPVIYVAWHQAHAYCAWAGRRLPTEAEWEKAARGTDGRTVPWGDAAPDTGLLNCDGSVGDTTRVGSYPGGASPYGALDLMGNVVEWVADCFDSRYYAHSPRQNPPGPVSCEHQHRVTRGNCSWAEAAKRQVGVADRTNDEARASRPTLGFRCAMSPSPVPMTSLRGEYLGQPRPGLSLERFAPELFSEGGRFGYHLHTSVYFTPDGTEVYFTNQTLDPMQLTILYMQQQEGAWSQPQVAPFSGRYDDNVAMFSRDGQRLYFSSNRPLDGGEIREWGFWFVERSDAGWSEPQHVRSSDELDRDEGTVYFEAELPDGYGSTDIYQAAYVDGDYTEPENLGDTVNSETSESTPTIAPDGSYLIYYRFDRADKATLGLYLTFRIVDGSWTEAIHLDTKLGLDIGFDASFSPDGKYLFLLDRGKGVYWVCAAGIERFRP